LKKYAIVSKPSISKDPMIDYKVEFKADPVELMTEMEEMMKS